MTTTTRLLPLTAAVLMLCAAGAQAQNIERVKMTDNDLSCQQIYSEIGLMDANIAKAGQPNVAVAQVDAMMAAIARKRAAAGG